MYTELHFNSELRSDTPKEVIKVLKFMLKGLGKEPELPNHELFKKGSVWRFMFNTDSYYFDADTHSTLRFDIISDSYYLCLRFNIKNYNSEIENFINWIKPYTNKRNGDFLGFMRYEEDEDPIIIKK